MIRNKAQVLLLKILKNGTGIRVEGFCEVNWLYFMYYWEVLMATIISGVESIYYLKQQSPMLHFQHTDYNATLRATELKPKLDRFIEKWMQHNKKELPAEWRLENKTDEKTEKSKDTAKTTALNYRVRIMNPKGNDDIYEPSPNMPFFGNMGNDTEKKMCIKNSKGCIEVYIRCYIEDLKRVIEDCLPTFFLTVNFGTRQDKGFGSFVLCANEKQTALSDCRKNEQLLVKWYGMNKVYCIKYKEGTSDIEILSDINTIYQLLKSGINSKGIYLKSYLMLYFNEKKIDWEKKALKCQKVAPVVNDKGDSEGKTPAQLGQNIKYVRGLFGVGDQQQWFSDDGFQRKAIKKDKDGKPIYNKYGMPVYKKETISIKSQSADIERVPSPLTFKIIGNSVYIFIEEMDSRIPGSWFTFTNPSNKKTIDLQIPLSGEYSYDEIMTGFKNRFNSPEVRSEFKKCAKKFRPEFIKQGCYMEVLGG